MVTLHEVITFLVSMQISISSLQTHNVNRCGRSRHLARKLSLRRKRSSPNVFEMARSEERFSRNAETEIVCRLLLEKKNRGRARTPAPRGGCAREPGPAGGTGLRCGAAATRRPGARARSGRHA